MLVVCAFHISFQLYLSELTCMEFDVSPYCFHACEILTYIPNIGNFYLLFFFLLVALVLWILFIISNKQLLIFLIFSVFFYFQFYSFLLQCLF